ncbi:beta-propeller fold lactonase family protein [Paraburkholderia youngii]|uniref:beta-propeller fold lactonase family protein n=1 Tax=Paraburkholderia youngii TaxID=2782701 RepID=UPI003D1A4E5D
MRNFCFDPLGRRFVVANQNSDMLVVFRVNDVTGESTDAGTRVEVGTAMCIKFTRV